MTHEFAKRIDVPGLVSMNQVVTTCNLLLTFSSIDRLRVALFVGINIKYAVVPEQYHYLSNTFRALQATQKLSDVRIHKQRSFHVFGNLSPLTRMSKYLAWAFTYGTRQSVLSKSLLARMRYLIAHLTTLSRERLKLKKQF